MTTHRLLTKVLSIWGIKIFRVLFALIFATSMIGVNPVSAAPSPRVMCENDASLVGCWRMEEGSGATLRDGSPTYLNDGAITGTPTFVTGQIGNAIALSGTGQYAMVTDKTNLDITSAITLAAWVKPGKKATMNIFKKVIGTAAPDGYELSLSSNQYVFIRINGGTTSVNSPRLDSTITYPIDGNTWMHIAATSDGSTLKVYINGAVNTTKTLSPSITIGTNNTNLGIGAEPATTPINLFQGAIDDARIYNRTLNLTEIAALASVMPPGDTTAPAAPTGLSATAGNATVGLTWDALALPHDVKGWNVYRSLTSPVATTTPLAYVTTEAYTDNAVSNGTTYYYTVKAVDTSNNLSDAAAEDSATPAGDIISPDPPTGLLATPGNTTVALSWTANSEGDLAGYNLYRGEADGGPYSIKVNSSLIIGTTTTDMGLTNGTTYYYVLKAVDTSTNESLASNQASASPVGGNTPPAAPIGHTATPGNTTVTLNWTANGEGEWAVFYDDSSPGPNLSTPGDMALGGGGIKNVL